MSNQDLDTEYTREEIKKIVKRIRLELYNQGLCCGAKAIKNRMEMISNRCHLKALSVGYYHVMV